MATKWYNEQRFFAEVNGRDYAFYCHTTYTRNGFCHTVETCVDGTFLRDTKVSYINRTWERFTYETALKSAIAKCPKGDQNGLRDIIIDRKAKSEHEEAEKFLSAFKSEYDSLSDHNKEFLKENAPVMETQEDASRMLGIMKIMNLLDSTK